MRVALPLLLAAAACGAPNPAPPKDPGPIGMNLPEDEIVAFLNGKPVMRRDVTDRAMLSEGKRLIDAYVGWRVRKDRIETLGITNTAEEIQRRAKAIVEYTRRTSGEEQVKAELAKAKLTEAEYIERWASNPILPERLAEEKALIYDVITEGSVEFDAAAFVDEREAIAFQSKLRNGADFDELVKELRGLNVKVGRWPRMRVSRALSLQVLTTDEWLTKHLFELKDGQISDIERTSSNYLLVLRCVRQHAPKPAAYAQLRDDVLAEVLQGRVQDPQIEAWRARLLKQAKVEYKGNYLPQK
jgi:hypothetical protein